MPYKSGETPSGTEKVPAHGKTIYRSAFNAAYEKYGEERAHAIAWSAVKRKYKKKGDRWVSKDADQILWIRSKDEGPGHPFRGNQYTTGESGGRGEGTSEKGGFGVLSKLNHPGHGYSKEAYEDDKGVIHTTKVEDAARALYEKRKVELNQPREASTLIQHLGKVAAHMKKLGDKAPKFNLCNVSIKGTNLFCASSLGIERVKMPQLTDEQTKGFVAYMSKKYGVEETSEHAAYLRATQDQLDGAKVAKSARDIKKDPVFAARRIVVSKENYILDGHHSWAAHLANDSEDGTLGNDTKMNITRINIPIIKLLEEADAFTGGKGHKALGDRRLRWISSINGDQIMRDKKKPDDDDDDDDMQDGIVQMTDSFLIDRVRRTKDGYLVCDARISRTGIQLYAGDELGAPDIPLVRVYRPPDEVFSKAAMHSLAHRPITLTHPPVMVDADNWKDYAVGHTGDEVTRDGDCVRVPMVIMDSKAIEAYEQHGVKELSVGYSTDLKWGEGRTPAGETYDAKQTTIRGNHLAVVPAARGGSRLCIGDEEKGETIMVKLLIDGQTIEFTDELVAKHVQGYISTLQKTIADQKKKDDDDDDDEVEREKKTRAETDALKGEVAALKKQLEDANAKVGGKAFHDAVREQIDLLLKAGAAMDGKVDFNGKDAAEIRRTVVIAKMGDAAKDLSDAEVVGAFKILTANVKPSTGVDRLADSLNVLNFGGGNRQNDARAAKDASYEEYVKNLSNAWRGPRAGSQ